MPKGGKFYAVRHGRKTGIFTSWAETLVQISGFSNAVYKSFSTKQDAVDWLEERPMQTPEDAVVFYTDGSHIKGTPKRGIGVFCAHGGAEFELAQPMDDLPEEASNPTLELLAALAALDSVPADAAPTKILIVADYIGVKQYVEGLWTPKASIPGEFQKAARRLAARCAALRNRGFEVRARHVDGHSGVPGNERADALAKQRTARDNLDALWKHK